MELDPDPLVSGTDPGIRIRIRGSVSGSGDPYPDPQQYFTDPQHCVKQIFFSALRKHGVKKGDRVVGYIPNCAEAIEAMAATAAIGAIWSSTSPDFGVSGVLDRFSQIQPKVRISILTFLSAFLASLISSHRYSLRFALIFRLCFFIKKI
jgi:hypothetical protein